MKTLFRTLGQFAPPGYKKWVEESLGYAGFALGPWKFIGLLVLYGLSAGLLASALLFLWHSPFLWVAGGFALGFFAVFALFNSILIVVVDNRVKFVEEVLPAALQLMAANMRSGLAPDRALLMAARPEVGPPG